MHEFFNYQIKILNGIDRTRLESSSPVQMKVIRADGETTTLEIFSDQSGLIGVLRYLHQQGYILLNMQRSLRSQTRADMQGTIADGT